MAAKKMKKPKMPASELFRRVESIVEKGTGIKKRVKKIEGLPPSDGVGRRGVRRVILPLGQHGREQLNSAADDARHFSDLRHLGLGGFRRWRSVGPLARLRHGGAGGRALFYLGAAQTGRCREFLRAGLR